MTAMTMAAATSIAYNCARALAFLSTAMTNSTTCRSVCRLRMLQHGSAVTFFVRDWSYHAREMFQKAKADATPHQYS
jgi:hypothetical protein